MSDSRNHRLYIVAEVTRGVTPDNPAWQELRHTACSIGITKAMVASNEIRDDRMVNDLEHGLIDVSGDIKGELSYGTYDALLEAVAMGTWARKATKTATTISAVASDNSFNDSGNGFITAGFEVGDEVDVSGFTGNVANNATFVITALTAGKMTIGGSDGDVIVDDAAGESVTIVTDAYQVTPSATRRTFSIMRVFSDLGSGSDEKYHVYTGIEFTKLALAEKPDGKLEITFSVIGKSQSTSNTAPSGSTYLDVTTTLAFAGFRGAIYEGGSSVSIITEASLELDNGMEPRHVIGSRYSANPTTNKAMVKGSVSSFFESKTIYEKFQDGTDTSIRIDLADAAGNALSFILPRCLYESAPLDVSQEDDIIVQTPFQTARDSTTGTNIIIRRNPAG